MTNEEKQQLAAQYWGQEVYHDPNFPNRAFVINGNTLNCISENGYLELKSLKNISDEDAIEFMNNYCGIISHIEKSYIEEKSFENNILCIRLSNVMYPHNFQKYISINELRGCYYDLFRSKGYALPFRQYSVEDLVKEGVIKLI